MAALNEVNVKVTADTTDFHAKLKTAQLELKKLRAEFYQSGPVNALFKMFMGRCTFFAVLFTVVGIILAFMGKLTADYVALVAAIQALLVVHSAKEDLADLRSAQDTTTVTKVEQTTVEKS